MPRLSDALLLYPQAQFSKAPVKLVEMPTLPCEGCTCGIAEYVAQNPNAWRCGYAESFMCEKR